MSKKVVSSPMDLIFRTLKDYEVSAEEIKELIIDLGMEDQIIKQLSKKEQEEEQTQVFNVVTYNVIDLDLIYKGIEYHVKVKNYDDDTDYELTYLQNNNDVPFSHPEYDNIINYVEEEVLGKYLEI